MSRMHLHSFLFRVFLCWREVLSSNLQLLPSGAVEVLLWKEATQGWLLVLQLLPQRGIWITHAKLSTLWLCFLQTVLLRKCHRGKGFKLTWSLMLLSAEGRSPLPCILPHPLGPVVLHLRYVLFPLSPTPCLQFHPSADGCPGRIRHIWRLTLSCSVAAHLLGRTHGTGDHRTPPLSSSFRITAINLWDFYPPFQLGWN